MSASICKHCAQDVEEVSAAGSWFHSESGSAWCGERQNSTIAAPQSPLASSGDLREDVAAAIAKVYANGFPEDEQNVIDADRFAADGAVAAVRAHDAAHPEPWQVTLIQALIAWGPGERAALILADIPAPVRAAAGLT